MLPPRRFPLNKRQALWVASAAGLLAALAYASTLMLTVSGGDSLFTVDTGEFQVALAEWGTVHHTGYPLYMLLGSPFVALLRFLGIAPAAGASIYSLVWAVLAVAGISLLALRLTGRPVLAVGLALAAGLTRSFWIHGSLAEVYSLSMLITVALLWVTLNLMENWQPRQVYLLAFLFGLGVAHHRLIAVALPGLLLAFLPSAFPPRSPRSGASRYIRLRMKHHRFGNPLLIANSPEATPSGRRPPLSPPPSTLPPPPSSLSHPRFTVPGPRSTLLTLLSFAAGFLPYLDMPLRVLRGATWVYGRPDTWNGFWFLFFGSEVEGLQRPVLEWGALLANVRAVFTILAAEMTWPGLLLALAGTALALWNPRTRRVALLLAGVAACYVLFSIVFSHAVLLEANLMTTVLCLVLGAGLGYGTADRPRSHRLRGPVPQASCLRGRPPAAAGYNATRHPPPATRITSYLSRFTDYGLRITHYAFPFLPFFLVIPLFLLHRPAVLAISRDPAGVNYIRQVSRLEAPSGAVVMAPWGWRYFALAYDQRVEGRFPQWNIVDHRADFAALTAGTSRAYTTADSFYIFTAADFWAPRLGGAHLSSAGPGLVRISAAPEMRPAGEPALDLGDGLALLRVEVRPPEPDGTLQIVVFWTSTGRPARDYSTFVHVSDQPQIASPADLIGQSDQIAPVYAWYATRGWTPGEVVREDHVVTLPPDRPARLIVVGMYYRDEAGAFVNLGSREVRWNGQNWEITE